MNFILFVKTPVTSIKDKVKQNKNTMAQVQANEKSRAMGGDLPKTVKNSVVQMLQTHQDLCQQNLSKDEKMKLIINIAANMLYAEKDHQAFQS